MLQLPSAEVTLKALIANRKYGKAATVASFAVELLADRQRGVREIFREAENAGYSRDQMKRVKRRAGVKAVKKGGEFGGKGAAWFWMLPPTRERETHKGAPQKDCSLVEKPLPCGDAPVAEDDPDSEEAIEV